MQDHIDSRDELTPQEEESLHGLEQSMAHVSGRATFSDYLRAQKSLRYARNSVMIQHRRNSSIFTGGGTATATGTNNNNNRASLVRRRSSARKPTTADDNAAWERVFHQLEAIDEDGHFYDDEDHTIVWYAPPVQRQRWGQDQCLPHINWADLFFDLFYVAAAYNLGVMLISALGDNNWLRGLIYYIGMFGPLYTTWETAMFYESRYTTLDYTHRALEVIRFLFVSVAVLHIKPLELLADPHSVETLVFIAAILIESSMHLGINMELYFKAQGDRTAIQNHTLVKMKYQLVPTILMYVIALTVAAIQYKEPNNDFGFQGRFLASTYGTDDDKGTQDLWILSDLPLTLTASAYVMNIAHTTFRKVRATNGKHGDIRTRYVPNNIDYVIHRYGEWTMLMIGESVLSLLIVTTTEAASYYTITTLGVLTVIFLQILKFESDPSHAEGHALWGNLLNSMCYGYLIQILSMGLIAFGVSFKIFLQEVVRDEEEEDRRLAASPEVSDRATANLFTGSLSVVLISLELMLLSHHGLRTGLKRLYYQPDPESDGETTKPRRKLNIPMVILTVIKLAVILFTLTLNQWTSDVVTLTICGLFIVLTMALTRVLGWAFIHHKEHMKEAITSLKDNIFSLPNSNIRVTYEGDESGSDAGSTVATKSTESPIEDSFDAIVVSDLKGIITQVNSTTLQMFGYATKEELVNKNLNVLIGGQDNKNHDMYMKRFREKGLTKTSKVLGKQRMLHAKKANGTEFPCIIGIKMAAKGTRVVGYIRDVSVVVEDEKKKMVGNMKVKAILDRVVDDHAFDAIIASDASGIIHRVNQQAVQEFGYDNQDEMVGQSICTLIYSVKDHPEKLLESHAEQHVVVLTRKDGRDFESIIATKALSGTDHMVVTYVRNIDPIKGIGRFDVD